MGQQRRNSSQRGNVRKNVSRNAKKRSFWQRFNKTYLFIGGAVVLVAGLGLAVSALLPETSPLSFNSLTRKSKTAPVRDTLTANYSVKGEAVSTSLLVKYKDATPETTRSKITSDMGGSTKRRIKGVGVDIVQVTSTSSMGETMQKFKSHAEVEYVEPNYTAKHFMTPNDTLYAKQWALQKIEAPKAWDVSQGGYGPIAVIDTGIAAGHSDLSGEVQAGYNFVADNTNAADDNGHGTHVAGIIDASSNNGNGIASIGFRGTLLPVKVLDRSGAGTYGDVASGIIYAADRGAKVLNMSLGGSSPSLTLQNAVRYAQSKGAIIVAAAGNNGNSSPVYPAAYPGVIAVSATSQDDSLASFSSYGSNVYVSAPGVGIVSTYSNGGYATLSGTSMAAPTVSGLIGLALSKGTTAPATVVNDLKTTSDKIGSYPYDQNGWNQYYGYGRINAAKLLGLVAVPPPAPTPTPPPSDGGQPPSNPPAHPNPPTRGNLQFDVVVTGDIDSVDLSRSVVVVKVKSSSSNLQLRDNNLIDLYVDASTILKAGGDNISLQQLVTGDNLNIKAQWKDNRLNAKEIITPAKQKNNDQNQPNNQNNDNGNGRGKGRR